MENRRVLIGWKGMSPDMIFTDEGESVFGVGSKKKAHEAIKAIEERGVYKPSENIIHDIGSELLSYQTSFWEKKEYENFRREKWEFRMVDIENLIVLQNSVESIKAHERVQDTTDTLAIAQITLPQNNTNASLVRFDKEKNTWIFSSRNRNLRIDGQYREGNIYGFSVHMRNSMVQVVRCKERYFLRDGTHRSFALMSRGITQIPALYREYDDVDFLLDAVRKPQENIFFGAHPPLLRDFLDPTLTIDYMSPELIQTITIQGLETTGYL